ncbi:MAG: PD-(D/E)XK nuclease family protein [Alphaproteobacteria bacterium]|nr:PD-(D/E)XK nuclease family protein [Alphaproteobacteria bacterium]
MPQNVYNIPFGAPFFDTLAKRFLEKYRHQELKLSDVLFLVQNRRSAVSFREAFLRQNGLKPFLLPQIVAVGDITDDALWLRDEDIAVSSISGQERLFLFAKLIVSKHDVYGIKDITFVQALALAADLARLIDAIYDQNLSFDDLNLLVPEEYAAHWQETLKFLKIITSFWPEILKERGLVDPAFKKNQMLKAKAKMWRSNVPTDNIVAVGLNPAFDGLKDVLSAIQALPCGEIYLYGLDRYLPDDVFDTLTPTHPQFENKEMLSLLNIKREDVEDIALSDNPMRTVLISEMMRPAETTAEWQFVPQKIKFEQACQGMHLIECADTYEEAASIALMMREVLETPEKTAVLVTPDRTLARCVSAALKRFGIDIDDSSGLPLHLSMIGIYLRQIIDVVQNDFDAVSVAALLKNPFVRLGRSARALSVEVRTNELEKRLPQFDQTPEALYADDILTTELKQALKPLCDLYAQSSVSLKTLMQVYIQTAEYLAQNDEMSGAQNLWRHEDGKKAAAYLAQVLEKADIIGSINPHDFGAVLTTLLSTESVRKNYGTHPRLKILGTIEARFNGFDVTIIGGVNEGVWPQLQIGDPFMSHTMKKDYGLPLPEQNIGIAAFDLSALLAAREVYLTRSVRTCGTPTNKSRYWLRLETMLRLLTKQEDTLADTFYQTLARRLNTPNKYITIEPAAPRPPVEARPRRFSATSLEKLMRNPYEIYARYILRLKVLNDLGSDVQHTLYGTIVHKILEDFATKYSGVLDNHAYEYLIKLGADELARYPLDVKDKAFFAAKFEKTAMWVCETESVYRQDIKHVWPEVKGKITLDMPYAPVVIEARADRIDETYDNMYRIIDYKTGRVRSKDEMEKGYAPQLAVEALIAFNGGFEKAGVLLPAKNVDRLIYWQLGKKIVCYDEDIDDLLEKTQERLRQLISVFDFETTPYLARPNPKHLDEYAVYEHLARLKEWSEVLSDD